MIGIMVLLPEQLDTVHKTADGRKETVYKIKGHVPQPSCP